MPVTALVELEPVTAPKYTRPAKPPTWVAPVTPPEEVELVKVPVFKRPTMPPTCVPPVTVTLEVSEFYALVVLPVVAVVPVMVELVQPTKPPTLLELLCTSPVLNELVTAAAL